MKTKLILTACVALAALTGCGGRGVLLVPVSTNQTLKETVIESASWTSSKVALIDVTGLIMNGRGGLLSSGENPVSMLGEKLDRARSDRNVKAVVLRLNSPGGTVQASESMAGLLAKFKAESNKPVIACITDVGASGAYHLACGAGYIVAQPSSITGSIGVIIQTVSFAGTMKMIGISAEAITSGKLKDMGSPLKDLSAEERTVFKAMVTEFYDDFVKVVAGGRKLDEAKVRELADGRVYTGTQALKLGLVDELGFVDLAIRKAKEAAKITKAKVVMYDRPNGYRANAYSSFGGAPTMQLNMVNIDLGQMSLLRRPNFLYLWTTDLRPASR